MYPSTKIRYKIFALFVLIAILSAGCNNSIFSINSKYPIKIEYYKNNKVKSVTFTQNGIVSKDSYREDGSLRSKIHYVNGKVNGIAYFFTKEGNLIEQSLWKNDKRNGLTKMYSYDDQVLISKINFKDNLLHGSFKSFNTDVSSDTEAIFNSGKLERLIKGSEDNLSVTKLFAETAAFIDNKEPRNKLSISEATYLYNLNALNNAASSE